MRTCFVALALWATAIGPAGAAQLHSEWDRASGPPLLLPAAIDEALRNNPDLIARRARATSVRERPAQERFLPPPMVEAQIWQWPIDSLNPANTNMFAFMATQDVPGRGKRARRAAVAGKDVELAANAVDNRVRQIVDQVKRAYADLFVARAATEIHVSTADVVKQLEQASQ